MEAPILAHPSTSDELPLVVDRVLSLRQVAEAIGLGQSTLERMIAAGDGPVITRISPRRLGVRASHLRAWLDARTAETSAA
jgi:predicted DNA-binding transcriptional regulator AlpA